jgi:haloalkane dehalogenase
VFEELRNGWREDMNRALVIAPQSDSPHTALYELPDESWNRRVNRAFANHLAIRPPDRAFSVHAPSSRGGYVVSVRAPRAHAKGADGLCREYPTGGRRHEAAGIDDLPEEALPAFILRFEAYFRRTRLKETPMTPLRTPDERFARLPGFAFAPHYLEGLAGFEGLRVHYLDEGPRDARHTFLCLHGQPAWSYLYRKMIPVFAAAGARVVVPDLIGFGRSDKPDDEAYFTFTRHRDMLRAFVERLDLANLTLVCQDWGGILGLTLPMEMPARFARLLVMNTALGTGDVPLGKGFLEWRAWSNQHPDMDIARLMKRAVPKLSDAEAAAYAAPFPDASYKAGVRRFPNLVPDSPDADGAPVSRRARDWLRTQWSGQTFMAVGAMDPVLGPPVMNNLRKQIRGCPEPYVVPDAGHFVQEWGEDIAQRALRAFG